MSGAASAPNTLRDRIRELIAREGERGATAHLRISRQTLARALAGLPIQTGTEALIRQRLDDQLGERQML
jgi:hypothetical protein